MPGSSGISFFTVPAETDEEQKGQKMKRIASLVLALVLTAALIAVPAAAAEVPNILKADRKVPAELTYSYKDAADTKYTPGYVLHYMDFSKVKSWDAAGYFATKDAEFTGFNLANGVLSVTSAGTKPLFMLTGNYIPKNITDFTFTVKYRVMSDTTRYLCFVHGGKLDAATGKTSGRIDTGIRVNGDIDGAKYDAAKKAEHDKLYAAMAKGEWVTASFFSKGSMVDTVVVECGGQTLEWTKTDKSKMTVPAGTDFGILISDKSHIEIASIQVVAGAKGSYSKLIWPGKEGELVQKVTETALLGYVPPVVTTAPTKPATPASPATVDIAVILAAVSAVTASGAAVLRKKNRTH